VQDTDSSKCLGSVSIPLSLSPFYAWCELMKPCPVNGMVRVVGSNETKASCIHLGYAYTRDEATNPPPTLTHTTTSYVTLTISMPYSAAGNEHSRERTVFVHHLSKDLEHACATTSQPSSPPKFALVGVAPATTSMLVVDVLIKAEHSEGVAMGLERQAQEPTSPLRSGVVTRYTQALHVWDNRTSSPSAHGKRSWPSDDKRDDEQDDAQHHKRQEDDAQHHKSHRQQHTTASPTLLSLPSFSMPSLPQMPWQKLSEAEDASDSKRYVKQELRYNRRCPLEAPVRSAR